MVKGGYYMSRIKYFVYELQRIQLNWGNRVWWFKLLVFALLGCAAICIAVGNWPLAIISLIADILYVWRYC